MINGTHKIDLDQLKQAIPIMDLAQLLGLEIRGRQARCFNSQAHKHGDKNFSLGLDTQHNRFKCFACGEQGSIIDLYKQVKKVDLNQAIRELADIVGLTITGEKITIKEKLHYGNNNAPQPRFEPLAEDLEACYNVYTELYFYCKGLDQESEQYLKNRGLTQETITRFLLFSIKDYQETDKHLKKVFTLDKLQKAGIIGERGNLIFFKHKIIIPFLQDSKIIFLQGRRTDDGQPKYLHLKRPVPLYNRDTLTKLEKGSKVYIAEGVFDAMMLEQNGYKAIGILGVNNFKPDYTELFKGFNVVLALDNDEAGERGTKELAKMFSLKGQGVSSKQLPDGIKDITDYFKSL